MYPQKKPVKGSPIKDYKQGEADLKAKKYRAALTAFKQALEKDNQHQPSRDGKFKVSVILAEQAMEDRDLELAEDYYKDAHLLKPNEHEVHDKLARIRYERYHKKR